MKLQAENLELLKSCRDGEPLYVVEIVEDGEMFQLNEFDCTKDIREQIEDALKETSYELAVDAEIVLGVMLEGAQEYIKVENNFDNPPRITAYVEIYRYPDSSDGEMRTRISAEDIEGRIMTIDLGSRELEGIPEDDEVLKVEAETILVDEILLSALGCDYTTFRDYLDINYIINH